jgi:hypothetical protein
MERLAQNVGDRTSPSGIVTPSNPGQWPTGGYPQSGGGSGGGTPADKRSDAEGG